MHKKVHLVDLDGAVDAPYKEVRRVETNSSGDEPEREHHQECVAKEEQRRRELSDLQLHTETHAFSFTFKRRFIHSNVCTTSK